MSVAFSFNTWNHSARWGLEPTLPQQIRAAADAGYDHVGLDVPSLLAHEERGVGAGEIRRYLDGAGISCFELVPLPITGSGDYDEGLARVRRLGPVVGARQVLCVIHGPVTTAALDRLRTAVDTLGALGIGVAIEYLPNLEVDSISAVRRIFDDVDEPALRVVVDSWHFFTGPDTWSSLEELPAERLGFVQFSDALPAVSDDVVEEYCHRRVLPGQGVHDLPGFSARVRDRWPDAVVSVEVLSSWWRARPAEQLVTAALRSTRRYWTPDT